MADPTRAEVITQLKNAVNILEQTRIFGQSATPNFIDLVDTYEQSIESDFAADALSIVRSARTSLSSLLTAAPSIIAPPLFAFGKSIDVPERDALSILGRLYDDFIDNSDTVLTRAFTFNAPVAGGANVGNGTIIRLNKDAENFDIENQTPDDKEAFCVGDANSGSSRNRELFQIRGGFGGVDALKIEGVGRTGTINAKSSLDSPIDNAGFDTITGTEASPTDIPGWTVTTTAGGVLAVDSTNFSFDSTNVYLPSPDDATTVRSLNIKALDARLEQKLVNKAISLDFNIPKYVQIAFNRQAGSADGTLRLTLGNQTVSVALVAQTGWNILSLPIDTNLWFKNFNNDDLPIRVERLTGTTGELLVDDHIFVDWDFFDGGWYLILNQSTFATGTSATPFLREDEFTWADTATESIIQRWLWRAFGVYLPHSGTPTVTDP